MGYRLEVTPEVEQWLHELCAADSPDARPVGAAVTALLTAGTGLGEPLVVTMESALLAQDPDPGPLLDYAYQNQLELLQQVRRGIADISTGRAGPPEEEQRLIELSWRLQREVDRFRISKEVAKAMHNAGRVAVELDAYLASPDPSGATEPSGPDSVAGLAAARAGIDELLAAAGALEQEIRADPFLAARLSPAPAGPGPLPGENLHLLRPGGAGDGEIRILFALAPGPGRTVLLLAAGQGEGDLWLWHRQAVQDAEPVLAGRSPAGAGRLGRRSRPGYSGRSFLRTFFPGRAREIRADAVRLLSRSRAA